MSGTKYQKPEWCPKLEFFTSLSADGKYVIHKTVITAIKPRAYIEKILSGPLERSPTAQAQAAQREPESAGD